MNDFGTVLRENRRLSGLSQRQLAEKVGVDFSYISKLENGRQPPPAAETVARLAEVLGCPVEDLLSAAKKMPANLNESVGQPAALRFLQEASRLAPLARGMGTTPWQTARLEVGSRGGPSVRGLCRTPVASSNHQPRKADMSQEWLNIQSFFTDHELIMAINDLSIAVKLDMAGVWDQERIRRAVEVRKVLKAFLGRLSEVESGDRKEVMLGVDARFQSLTDARWPPPDKTAPASLPC